MGRKHLPNVYFSLREASKHLLSRPKHLQPAPTVTRARPGGGPLPHSPGTPRPGQPLATYLGPKAARYAGISPVLARLNPLFRSENPYQTLGISSKHLRQTLRFRPKHLPNTPQKVLRSTLIDSCAPLVRTHLHDAPIPSPSIYRMRANEACPRFDCRNRASDAP